MVNAKASGLTAASVPSRGDPDRKRALNVLAQRRYRRRKAEKMAALEAQLKATSTSPKSSSSSHYPGSASASDEMICGSDELELELEASGSGDSGATLFQTFATTDQSMPAASSGAILDDLASFDQPLYLPAIEFGRSGSTPFGDSPAWDLSTLVPGVESSNQPFSSSYGFLPMLSNDTVIDVPLLKTMQVGMAVAQMVGAGDTMWDPFTLRTFDGKIMSNMQAMQQITELPADLKPTDAQKSIPHHPLIDCIPWPSVRTKLVVVFNLPPTHRPPGARDPLSILQLFYDIDDPAEGFRIVGPNGMDGKNWEIGDKFWRTWWWSVDREVVENTNNLRKQRGANRLRIEDVDRGVPL
ncbi:hypothetical protein P152DRAFT_458082 [Eremomyces bilateralis CBS 781.70]|uniref:BZIP domain-containing protein n=1 Tax=Eremomyces bilateralis CBS 781.70 TaxID=1392243 RepID=A0A6G1G4Z1_9PEZI|nr:uncharacterized protein P152DRAFT_458082 [Eremomyces bilateralis CBS 781.70]KAF1812899.1 hypothetical protein P152DRAFT_458082 [Eremomyces bilateralis CBS 781.70]